MKKSDDIGSQALLIVSILGLTGLYLSQQVSAATGIINPVFLTANVLPATGESNTIYITIAAIILLLGGIALLIKRNRK